MATEINTQFLIGKTAKLVGPTTGLPRSCVIVATAFIDGELFVYGTMISDGSIIRNNIMDIVLVEN